MTVPEWCFPAIHALRALLKAEWEKGSKCPCCEQTVMLRKRRVNSGTAEVLVEIARLTIKLRTKPDHFPFINVEREIIYGNEKLQGARDWQTLKFWGLVEPLDGGTPDSSRVPGEWRLTPKGLWVVEHPEKDLLHSYVLVYNNKKRGESKTKCSLRDALRRPFDVAEVRRAA